MSAIYIARSKLNLLLSRIEHKDVSPVVIEGDSISGQATIYLSERNVKTLLSKLDRLKNGERTLCTIVKHDTVHPNFPCSEVIAVTAVEDYIDEIDFSATVYAIADSEYYADRIPGGVLAADTPK